MPVNGIEEGTKVNIVAWLCVPLALMTLSDVQAKSMQESSEVVWSVSGIPIRTSTSLVPWPGRHLVPRFVPAQYLTKGDDRVIHPTHMYTSGAVAYGTLYPYARRE